MEGGGNIIQLYTLRIKNVERFSKLNFEILLCFLPSRAQQAWPLAWLQIRAQQILINQDQTDTIKIRQNIPTILYSRSIIFQIEPHEAN